MSLTLTIAMLIRFKQLRTGVPEMCPKQFLPEPFLLHLGCEILIKSPFKTLFLELFKIPAKRESIFLRSFTG